MYFPYFRAKRYELSLLKNYSVNFSEEIIHPIIEPVKQKLNDLERAIKQLISDKVTFTLIINPYLDEYVMGMNKDNINQLVQELKNGNGIGAMKIGILLNEETDLNEIKDLLNIYIDDNICLIHNGFPKAMDIIALTKDNNIETNAFVDRYSSDSYINSFQNSKKVIIKDGFKKKATNKEYPYVDYFSDLHKTYKDKGFDGFGDFLIAGYHYSNTGGPAYAVALHTTHLESQDNMDMYVKHYISDSNNNTDNPGKKFFEALRKLVKDLNEDKLLLTHALSEYKNLFTEKHYPGLGYAKKLSMQHHLEVMIQYLEG